MPGAGAEFASRLDLAALGNVAAQARGVLVVDLADVVDAEAADFAPSTKAAAPTAAARSASRGARATSASWAALTAGTIAAERTVALRAGPEPGAWRLAFRSAPTRAIEPLSWSVIAHRVLSLSVATVFVIARQHP